jgi:hypothetical protein
MILACRQKSLDGARQISRCHARWRATIAETYFILVIHHADSAIRTPARQPIGRRTPAHKTRCEKRWCGVARGIEKATPESLPTEESDFALAIPRLIFLPAGRHFFARRASAVNGALRAEPLAFRGVAVFPRSKARVWPASSAKWITGCKRVWEYSKFWRHRISEIAVSFS